MGNTPSINSNTKAPTINENAPDLKLNSFYDVIDYIATHYILTMDFKSLSKLSEKAYCDKLIILTSDIIQKNFNDMEVTYLAQRIKNGLEVNELKTENVSFVTKDGIDGLDISNDEKKSLKKKRVCIGIAKFYVKIAHLFAAIVMTINPVYTYKDNTGHTVKVGLMEKDTIPKGTEKKLYKLNICDNRIRALKRGTDNSGNSTSNTTANTTANTNVTLQPKICDVNITKTGIEKTLADEPGIPELMDLYLDDKYDFSNGAFTGMSDKTREQFMKDLQQFYTAFTGNEIMPKNITKFSDIKLHDYSKIPGCQGDNPILNAKYCVNKKDRLFIEYAENIRQMIKTASENQSKLLTVINDLFTYVIDPYSGKKVIRVNPLLNDELLQKSVEKTRKLIIDLYVRCETDYVKGVKLYEAIVESKILETTQKQIENLKSEASEMISKTLSATDSAKEAK
jgi:hypothetical protein